MVLLKMLMEIALPKMGERLVMMMTMISPFGREVPPGGIAPLEGKCAPTQVPPRDGGAPSQKSSSYFSRSKRLIYQKKGTGGGPG